MTAAEQLAQIQPGDVFQHPATGADDLPGAVDSADAQHVVAHGAPGDPARAGQVGGNGAANGAGGVRAEQAAVIRRFGDQMLALGGGCRDQFGQRRAGAGGQHQFLGGIEGDPGQTGGGKAGIGPHRAQHGLLAAGTLNAQRAGGVADRGDHAGFVRRGHARNAAVSGKTLLAFNSQPGSKADLIRRC